MARVERAKVRDAGGVVWRGDVLKPGAVGRAQAVAVQVREDWPSNPSGWQRMNEAENRRLRCVWTPAVEKGVNGFPCENHRRVRVRAASIVSSSPVT